MSMNIRGSGMGRQMTGGRWEPGSGYKPNTPRKVLESFRPYVFQLSLIVAAVLISVALNVVRPLFLRVIIDDGITDRHLDIVVRYSIYSLASTIGGTAFGLAYNYQSILVGQMIMRDFRDRLYRHLQGMSLRFFSSTRTGEIQSRLANDVGGVQSVLSDTASTVLANLTTVISSIIVMILIDWRLTLLSVGLIPLFAIIGARIGNVARQIRTAVQTHLAEMNSTMQETLSVSGVLLTKTSGRQALALGKFSKENAQLTAAQIRQTMVMRFFFNLIGLTFSLTPVLVYWLAGFLAIRHPESGLTVGKIVAFTAAQAGLFFPLTSLFNVQVDVSSSLALFDRIFEYLDLKQEIADAPDAIDLPPDRIQGRVSFENVSFSYAEDTTNWDDAEAVARPLTLEGIDFDAKPGQLVALVGHSGAGKTTLTYLIPRLYDVVKGSVRIDGHDVRKIKLESLGQAIGVVTQETYLVHDTIRENLRYGKPDATDDELIAAAQTAAIHNHIASLPEGYDTIVGERGYKLSGGEKQRIAIARAVLKDPRILILDEATSSLDTQSERLIQAALVPLMAGRTTFAIAHRLSTILAADLILVMEAGRVVERGRHEELLSAGGAYARLYAAQFESHGASEPLSVGA